MSSAFSTISLCTGRLAISSSWTYTGLVLKRVCYRKKWKCSLTKIIRVYSSKDFVKIAEPLQQRHKRKKKSTEKSLLADWICMLGSNAPELQLNFLPTQGTVLTKKFRYHNGMLHPLGKIVEIFCSLFSLFLDWLPTKDREFSI